MQEHNEVLLNRKTLVDVLNDLSNRLLQSFGFAVRLVIHGGAFMVLHRSFKYCRESTRDVDYCHRSFVAEMAKRGLYDAGNRLTACIDATARVFGLGRDWMNAHADVALPMAVDPTTKKMIDPIYKDALAPGNLYLNTVYSSAGLILVGVSWSWAVALKLVRYQKSDPSDIAAILALGKQMKGVEWTRDILERWLLKECVPMGYDQYSPQEIEKTRNKMRDAVYRMRYLISNGTLPPPDAPLVPYPAHVIAAARPPSFTAGAPDVRVRDSTGSLRADTHARARLHHARSSSHLRQPSHPTFSALDAASSATSGGSSDPAELQSQQSHAHRVRSRSSSARAVSVPPSMPVPMVPAPPVPPLPAPNAVPFAMQAVAAQMVVSSRPSSILSVLSSESLLQLPKGFVPQHIIPAHQVQLVSTF